MGISVEAYLLATILVLLMFMYYVVNKGKGTILDRFTSKFSIIGSIFVPIGIFLTYRVFTAQINELSRKATYDIIDRGWLNINKMLIDYYEDCPYFINSLYFDWQKKVLGKVDNLTQDNDKWYAVNYLSIAIFQSWEDFLTSSQIDQTGHIVWLNNFLQWSNSSVLRSNWSVLKSNYADTTQEFGDYLFYLSAMYKPKDESELNNLAKTAVESEKIRSILSKRFQG